MIGAQVPFLNRDGTVSREWFIFLATLNTLVGPNNPSGGASGLSDVSLLAQLDQTSTIDDLAKLKQDLYDAILNRPFEVLPAPRQQLQGLGESQPGVRRADLRASDFGPVAKSDRRLLHDLAQLDTPPPGSWQAYTPAVTAGSGTFTTVSAAGRFQRVGRTVSFTVEIDVATVGTATSFITVALPVKPNSALPSGFQTCVGREVSATGKAVTGTIGEPSGSMLIVFYDNSFPGASGNKIVLGGSYEAA